MVRLPACIALIGVVAAVGCQQIKPPPTAARPIDYMQDLPPGTLALRKISPSEYPTFTFAESNAADLRTALQHSLTYLRAPSSWSFFPYEDISHDRAVATCYALRQTLDELASADNVNVNAAIASRFEVYQSVGAPRAGGGYTGEVLFTGYCTPIYSASLQRTDEFRYPLYKRPADLVSSAGDSPNGAAGGGKREASGQIVPYADRREIETTGLLAGQELVWLKERFDAYVITVQGSARLQLTDGSMLDVGYAGNNGRDYVSPGQQMVADGLIARRELSLPTLRAYFAAHPDAMDKYLLMNPREIFFMSRPGGPFGSLNEPVTPGVTIATDKPIFPRAMPTFVVAARPRNNTSPTFRQFRVDQDTGKGIRAAGRCDLYFGVGPDAESQAGNVLVRGQLYYLAVKPELVDQFLHP